MAMDKPSSFDCLNCGAPYQLVKAEAGPETVDRAVSCRSCGEALPGRERALFRVSTLDFANLPRTPWGGKAGSDNFSFCASLSIRIFRRDPSTAGRQA